MCDSAYHNEALRKQRIIERKHQWEAENRKSQRQGPGQTFQDACDPTEPFTDPRKMPLDSGYRRSMFDKGLWSHDSFSAPMSYNRLKDAQQSGKQKEALHPQWPLVYRELKGHARRLRNHNMYMGTTTAFADLFEANNYRKKSTDPKASGSSPPPSRSGSKPKFYPKTSETKLHMESIGNDWPMS